MLARTRAIALATLVALVSGCGGSDTSGPLTPARNLVGTWKTNISPTVFFDTEWCGSTLALAASQTWAVTWIITPGVDENTVNVEMRFAASNSRVIAGCPDTGVVPEVSPMFFTANVSSSALTLKKGSDVAGQFTFTTDILQGNFDYTWCAIYCQREYTTNRTMILLRQ